MNFLKSRPIPILRDTKKTSTVYIEPRRPDAFCSNGQTSGWSKVANKLEDNFLTRMIKKISSIYNDKRKAQYDLGIRNTAFDNLESSSLPFMSEGNTTLSLSDFPDVSSRTSIISYSPSHSSSPIGIKIKSEKVFNDEAIHLFKSNSFDDILEFGYRWPNERNVNVIETVKVSLTPPSLSFDYPRESVAFPCDSE